MPSQAKNLQTIVRLLEGMARVAPGTRRARMVNGQRKVYIKQPDGSWKVSVEDGHTKKLGAPKYRSGAMRRYVEKGRS